MERLKRAAVLLSLIEQLQKGGSWCGETHIQKTAYFLQEMLHVPLGFEFILYKHGPYSFDLSDELTVLQADQLLRVHIRNPNYGPSLLPADGSEPFLKRYPKTRAQLAAQVTFVTDHLARKNVNDLEKLATALYVSQTSTDAETAGHRSKEIHRLKPHISLEEAQEAVRTVDAIRNEATKMNSP